MEKKYTKSYLTKKPSRLISTPKVTHAFAAKKSLNNGNRNNKQSIDVFIDLGKKAIVKKQFSILPFIVIEKNKVQHYRLSTNRKRSWSKTFSTSFSFFIRAALVLLYVQIDTVGVDAAFSSHLFNNLLGSCSSHHLLIYLARCLHSLFYLVWFLRDLLQNVSCFGNISFNSL